VVSTFFGIGEIALVVGLALTALFRAGSVSASRDSDFGACFLGDGIAERVVGDP
jgi:hypothetical protein